MRASLSLEKILMRLKPRPPTPDFYPHADDGTGLRSPFLLQLYAQESPEIHRKGNDLRVEMIMATTNEGMVKLVK